MALVFRKYDVRSVMFSARTSLAHGVLTIDGAALGAALRDRDERIESAEIHIARPGEATRVLCTKDVIQPRYKVEGTQVLALIEQHIEADASFRPALIIAGPAFNAGRYGMACGAVCHSVQERLNLPAITAVYPENPAVDHYRSKITMVRAEDSVLGMQDAIVGMVHVGKKLLRGEAIDPAQDHTIPQGLRQNYFAASSGASRAIEMLMNKLAGQSFQTEYAMPVFDRVEPAPAIDDIRSATVAVVTSGGIVPRGNPDRIESASASKYGAYSLAGLRRLTSESHQSVHGGYDATYANQDPNRVLPLDALRELEQEGRFGRLHGTYYATVGNATSVRQAVRFGQEIAAALINEGVQAVILTST